MLYRVDFVAVDDLVFTTVAAEVPAMVESIKRYGFKQGRSRLRPLMEVVEKPDGSGGVVYVVVSGNRRGAALLWLRDNDPEGYRRALPVLPEVQVRIYRDAAALATVV